MGRLKRYVVKRLLRGAICFYGWNTLNSPGIWLTYAYANSSIVSKLDKNWRLINGVVVRTRNTQTFLAFRRRPTWL